MCLHVQDAGASFGYICVCIHTFRQSKLKYLPATSRECRQSLAYHMNPKSMQQNGQERAPETSMSQAFGVQVARRGRQTRGLQGTKPEVSKAYTLGSQIEVVSIYLEPYQNIPAWPNYPVRLRHTMGLHRPLIEVHCVL